MIALYGGFKASCWGSRWRFRPGYCFKKVEVNADADADVDDVADPHDSTDDAVSVDGSENNGTVSADVADTGVNLEASATTMDDQPVADDDVDDTPFDNDPTVSQGQGSDYIGVDDPVTVVKDSLPHANPTLREQVSRWFADMATYLTTGELPQGVSREQELLPQYMDPISQDDQRRLQLLRSDDNLIEVGRLAPQVGRPRELRLMEKREMAARSMSRSSGTCKICGTSKDHRSARTCPIVKNRDHPAVWLNSKHDRLQFMRNVGSKSFSRIYTPSDREVEAAWPTDLETLPVPEGTLIVVVTRLWLGEQQAKGLRQQRRSYFANQESIAALERDHFVLEVELYGPKGVSIAGNAHGLEKGTSLFTVKAVCDWVLCMCKDQRLISCLERPPVQEGSLVRDFDYDLPARRT